MVYTNLDIITRRGLLENGLSIHYYAEMLFHAATCLRELTFDTLKIVNTRSLPVNEYAAVDLPDDFVEDVAVCFDYGNLLQPIPQKSNINPIRYNDPNTGEFAKPPVYDAYRNNGLFYGMVGWTWYWNINDYAEPTGRLFGATGAGANGYKVVKERNQIQLTGNFNAGNIVLQYISDGQNVDAASQIDPQAFSTIRAYQDWKRSPNATNPNSPQAYNYKTQRRLLRARLNDLSLTDIKETLRSGYTAAIKN